MSKTQIDQLGDRLRKGHVTEADLQFLDTYRRSFAIAYEHVVKTLRNELSLEPTGRPAKSTSSVIEKLRRESTRLTQMQDIAGCRLIVGDIAEQDRITALIKEFFNDADIVDRRKNPSHGYQAVHVIVTCDGKPIEIQVRTSLQHLWAELSEKFSDVVDPMIKYGGGDEPVQSLLGEYSELVAVTERNERTMYDLEGQVSGSTDKEQLTKIRAKVNSSKEGVARMLEDVSAWIEKKEGEE